MQAEYDVVIAGGGNAALCAALTAREAGASVLVAERAPRELRGGNSRHTRNLRVMHERPTATLTGAYTEEEYWSDLLGVTQGQTNEVLARTVIRSTATLLPWMQAHGVAFQPSLRGTLSLSRTNAFFLGGGKALLNAYYAAAHRLGVEVLYETEVHALALDHHTARRVEIIRGGQSTSVRARAVVVCSGGFQANLGWLRQYWGEAADNFIVRGTPYASGSLLKHLLDQGAAAAGDPAQCHCIAVDARAPKFDAGIVTRLDCIPFGIVVDCAARRFYDEGEESWPKRYAIWGRLVARQPGQIAFAIFDSKAESLFMPSAFPAFKGDTISELAARLGLDPIALNHTVHEFNRAVRPGTFQRDALDDCRTVGLHPEKSHWARPIDTPPFIGYPLRPGITFTYLGLKIDARAHVLAGDGLPMTNLFAAGEVMAGNILGQGYTAGIGMAIGAAFGRIAGREAAHFAKN